MDHGRRGKGKKLPIFLVLLVMVGGAWGYLALRHVPAPTQPVTKVIESDMLKK